MKQRKNKKPKCQRRRGKHVFKLDGGECIYCGKTWIQIQDKEQ